MEIDSLIFLIVFIAMVMGFFIMGYVAGYNCDKKELTKQKLSEHLTAEEQDMAVEILLLSRKELIDCYYGYEKVNNFGKKYLKLIDPDKDYEKRHK